MTTALDQLIGTPRGADYYDVFIAAFEHIKTTLGTLAAGALTSDLEYGARSITVGDDLVLTAGDSLLQEVEITVAAKKVQLPDAMLLTEGRPHIIRNKGATYDFDVRDADAGLIETLAPAEVALFYLVDGATAGGSWITIKLVDGGLVVGDGTITSAKLANGAATTAKIADSNVTQSKINDGAVSTSKLADVGVTEDKIASGAVTSAKIGAGAVNSSRLADQAVDPTKIKSGVRAALAGTAINFKASEILTRTLTANTTFTISNPKNGHVIDLEVTGAYTLTLPGTVKVMSGSYDGAETNHVMILCVDETAPKYIATISQE